MAYRHLLGGLLPWQQFLLLISILATSRIGSAQCLCSYGSWWWSRSRQGCERRRRQITWRPSVGVRGSAPRPAGVVYVSRARFAPCTNADLLKGAFAAEELQTVLLERGVTVVHPETLGLKDQLEIYLGAKTLAWLRICAAWT